MADYTLTDDQEDDFYFANGESFSNYIQRSFPSWTESAKSNRKEKLKRAIDGMDPLTVNKLIKESGVR